MTIDVTRGVDHALVHLDSGLVPLHRSEQAREIIAAFRQAEDWLEDVERNRQLLLDKQAAARTNHRFRLVNASKPGTPVVQPIPIRACACSRTQVCAVCCPDSPEPAA